MTCHGGNPPKIGFTYHKSNLDIALDTMLFHLKKNLEFYFNSIETSADAYLKCLEIFNE